MDTAGNEPFEKLEKQLDETQALGWRMGQYMAESRNVLSSCIRLKSELQYEYFTELILEAAKTSRKADREDAQADSGSNYKSGAI